ncbi:transcriptional regulator [Bifidobacterium aemilianum]|uniref:Transcriptional regulator n=1 Tax=Bifidobacterium aemilianum TaxID=2493120 RepID=A0A366K7H6_9BIFI|nr:response regulator transcription factor [Bifidobacterium aemilianum]RBP97686.1 transcriptional regulator [Bifidobacterium aemilianum]
MTDISLMTSCDDPASVLPSLTLLSHRIRVLPMDAASLVKMPENTILLMDAREDLAAAKTLCSLIKASGLSTPILLVLTEGGFTVVNHQWGISDVVVQTASPAEVEGRLRLALEGGNSLSEVGGEAERIQIQKSNGRICSGDLVVDTNSYTANLHGYPIDLAYKEFELLKYLVQHPGRVFTRTQLLQEVWGYDYYGGTRTVDVHIRRLRAKLGSEYEHLIGTVRNVGYRFDPDEGLMDGTDGSAGNSGRAEQGEQNRPAQAAAGKKTAKGAKNSKDTKDFADSASAPIASAPKAAADSASDHEA